MKRLLIIIMWLPLLAACSSTEVEDDTVAPLNGPSLVMFYTDN